VYLVLRTDCTLHAYFRFRRGSFLTERWSSSCAAEFGPYDLQQRSVMYQGANRGDGMCTDATLGPTTGFGRWGCTNGFTSAWNHYSFPGSNIHSDAADYDTRFDILLHDVKVQNYR
jgi:hypothetical protein